MSIDRLHSPQKRSANLRSLLLFVLTVAFAIWQRWTAADVAWSMWVASLIGGYVIMAYMASSEAKVAKLSDLPSNPFAFIIVACIMVVFGLFSSVFVLFHFTAFHVGHAAFLSELLPMSQIEVQAVKNPLEYGRGLAHYYWPFAVLVIIHTIFKVRESGDNMSIMTPYISVVKNHILIFIVAFLQALETPVLMFYILLFYYFFPVRDSWALLKSAGQRLRR